MRLLRQGYEAYRRGAYETAADMFRTQLQSAPADPRVQLALGVALRAQGDYDEAERCYRRVLDLHPASSSALQNLGNLLLAAGRAQEAAALFDRAVRIAPQNTTFRWARSLALLASGDLYRGFEAYECRWSYARFLARRPHATLPVWDGRPAPDKKILVEFEQGLGDSIQFSRFLPWVTRHAGQVRFETQPELLSLFRDRIPGVDVVARSSDAAAGCDLRVWLMSLPHLYGAHAGNLPAPLPSLHRSVFARRGGGDTTLRVGLCWAGNSKHLNDALRSIAFAELAPLWSIANVEWVSLTRDADLRGLNAPGCLQQARLDDFEATAHTIAGLDVVVTVDTSVAHLAGTMGVPVWILLAQDSDWRWMRERATSPWYESARLVRQARLRDWRQVVARVASDIGRLQRMDRVDA